MRQDELERVFRDMVLVPGPEGPCDARTRARMREDYRVHHERILAYGRARRDAQVQGRRHRGPKKDDPS